MYKRCKNFRSQLTKNARNRRRRRIRKKKSQLRRTISLYFSDVQRPPATACVNSYRNFQFLIQLLI
ncbi:unnamed protein product [Citrullus colocynthis]|uniref:Uncharacterized protein n=1 Tax=Citrullus colocynthis TaxID=252529 RepID=A0ABP0YXX4_9ROSI